MHNLDGFQFDDEAVLNQHVNLEGPLDRLSLVLERYTLFAFVADLR